MQDVLLLTLIHRTPFLFSVCVYAKLRFNTVTENNNKKCQEQPAHSISNQRKLLLCSDDWTQQLDKILFCLTKCFLSDTLDLSWVLAAWFQVFICALLWGSVSISGGFGFCHHCDPTTEDTWCIAADGAAAAGLHSQPDGAMLALSGGPLPCPPSIRQRPFCVTFWHICWQVSFGNRC